MRDMGPRPSIRNIPIPKNHRRAALVEEETDEEQEDRGAYQQQPPRARRRSGRKLFWTLAILFVLLCAVGGILLSTLFAGATVTVFERQESITGPLTLTASLNPPTGSLGYGVMSGTRSATTTVPATGTKEVSRAASGIITVYNAYSTEPQRLIARTRFEAPDGKVYRIQESIDVPGATGTEGNLTPGSLSVTVYADAPGASYNRSGDTRFTLPALKGDPRYDTMYAEGQSISGGLVGPEPAVAEADLTRAEQALQQGLAQAAQSALASQIPAGYLVIPGSLDITYSSITQVAGEDNTAILSQTATLQAAIVKTDDLANAVAKQKVSGYGGEAVTFVDPTGLAIAATSSPASETDLSLNLTGELGLKWRYDPTALTNALLGKPKAEFQEIIQSFSPAIRSAEAKVRPFWDGSFPSDQNKIEVVPGEQ